MNAEAGVSITKNDLAIEIARKCNVDQKKVKQVIQLTLDSIIDVLVNEVWQLAAKRVFKFRCFGPAITPSILGLHPSNKCHWSKCASVSAR